MKIEITQIDFSGPAGFTESANPDWSEIEQFVIQHLQRSIGLVELSSADDVTISIRGDSDLYVVEIDSPSNQVFKLLISSSTENPDKMVPMCDGESRKGDTLGDLHQAIMMVRTYLESGELVDSEPYHWKDS